MDNDITIFKTFGEALAIGLLIGVERYKGRRPGEKKSSGVRTFTIFALLGAVCGLLPSEYTLMTIGALIVLLSLGYYRQSSDSMGITTEVAALLTFWLGYMLHTHESLSISVAIVLVILLASKRALHDFVKEKVSETEFYDTLKFLAVVFVMFPLLPNRNIGPYEFFNPTHVWMLIILVSTISYSGYILVRILGVQKGLTASAIAGGIVSTTATTMSLAERTRLAPASVRTCTKAAILANAVQFPRLLLLVWIVDQDLGLQMAAPLLGMGAVGMLGASIWERPVGEESPMELPAQNPYSLMPALKFGLFFVGVFFLSKVVLIHLGEQGIQHKSVQSGDRCLNRIPVSRRYFVYPGVVQLVDGRSTQPFGNLIQNAGVGSGNVSVNHRPARRVAQVRF